MTHRPPPTADTLRKQFKSIPAVIDIMITVGPKAEGGEVCFPPASDR